MSTLCNLEAFICKSALILTSILPAILICRSLKNNYFTFCKATVFYRSDKIIDKENKSYFEDESGF